MMLTQFSRPELSTSICCHALKAGWAGWLDQGLGWFPWVSTVRDSDFQVNLHATSSQTSSLICLSIFLCPSCKMPVNRVSTPASCIKILPSLPELEHCWRFIFFILLSSYFFILSSSMILPGVLTELLVPYLQKMSVFRCQCLKISHQRARDSGPRLGSSQSRMRRDGRGLKQEVPDSNRQI